MAKKLYLMCGIPGSGKSTWIRNHMTGESDCVHISRDEIRFATLKDGDDYFKNEKFVFNEFVKKICDCLKTDGINKIFVDATHITLISRAKILNRLPLENVDIYAIVFHTPLHECLFRNSWREGRAYVPEKTIQNMAAAFEYPKIKEGFKEILSAEDF